MWPLYAANLQSHQFLFIVARCSAAFAKSDASFSAYLQCVFSNISQFTLLKGAVSLNNIPVSHCARSFPFQFD
ncbi:hypothetical protein EDD85DRAFT_806790 [Armillaria nabsnona]|nr:hypothetical protein EDD85DRAFT_806790 [Armillaria nabsnona]